MRGTRNGSFTSATSVASWRLSVAAVAVEAGAPRARSSAAAVNRPPRWPRGGDRAHPGPTPNRDPTLAHGPKRPQIGD